MKEVYYYSDNLQEPKPGDLLFLWAEKIKSRLNFIGIILSTGFPTKANSDRLCYSLEVFVLKLNGTIDTRILIWCP